MREAFVNRLLPATAILCGIVLAGVRARAGDLDLPVASTLPLVETHCFAIMGEVARPGVFEATEQRLQLTELVERAGGTTPTASGNVRIIRAGRAGEQTFLTPGRGYEVQANDLVIVDARQSRPYRPGGSGPDLPVDLDSSESPVEGSRTVQLGLVNVISRPLVLGLNPEEATLGKVLSFLQQSPHRIRGVTIVKSLAPAESVACGEASGVRLASGSVLVFAPGTVDPKVLPPLPATVPVPQIFAPPTSILAVPDKSEPDESIPQALTRIRAEKAATTPPLRGDHVCDLAPARSAAAMKGPAGSQPERKPVQAEPTTVEPHPASSHTGLLVLIGALIPGLVIFAVKHWGSRRRTETELPAKPLPELNAAQALKALISNTLPVIEEPLKLPSEREIFGHPRLDSPYRIDAAHVLSGPHFPVEPARPAVREREAYAATSGQPDAAGRRKAGSMPPVALADSVRETAEPMSAQPRVEVRQFKDDASGRLLRIDKAHPRTSLGALDRALAVVEEGRS
jgi:hypothetical protein